MQFKEQYYVILEENSGLLLIKQIKQSKQKAPLKYENVIKEQTQTELAIQTPKPYKRLHG